MPIKIDVIDNSSQVRVKPRTSEEINLKSNCNTQGKVLENKIEQEKAARITADEELQAQIDQKQDNISFIYLSGVTGVLTNAELKLLIKNKVNRLVYNNTIYYLSIVDNRLRKYFSRAASSEYNEVDVDTQTGAYEIISKMDPKVKSHLENTIIHITEAERLFWNNKVTTDIEKNETDDSTLILKKD